MLLARPLRGTAVLPALPLVAHGFRKGQDGELSSGRRDVLRPQVRRLAWSAVVLVAGLVLVLESFTRLSPDSPVTDSPEVAVPGYVPSETGYVDVAMACSALIGPDTPFSTSAQAIVDRNQREFLISRVLLASDSPALRAFGSVLGRGVISGEPVLADRGMNAATGYCERRS